MTSLRYSEAPSALTTQTGQQKLNALQAANMASNVRSLAEANDDYIFSLIRGIQKKFKSVECDYKVSDMPVKNEGETTSGTSASKNDTGKKEKVRL